MAVISDELIVLLQADIKGLRTALTDAGKSIERFEDKAERSNKNVEKSFLSLKNVSRGYAAYMATRFVKDVVKSALSLEQLENKMQAAGGSAEVAQRSMEFLRSESDRLGLQFESSANAFASFQAAALRSGLTVKQVEDIFTGTAEAGAALKLSASDMSLALTALSQIASKGTVSMEELRQQLGERIPGAMQIAAQAMGMTTSEFDKAVSQGKILASDLLPKLGEAFSSQFGKAALNSADSATAAINRMQNALFELKTSAASGEAMKSFTNTVEALTETLNDPAMQEGLGIIITGLAKIVEFSAKAAAGLAMMARDAKNAVSETAREFSNAFVWVKTDKLAEEGAKFKEFNKKLISEIKADLEAAKEDLGGVSLGGLGGGDAEGADENLQKNLERLKTSLMSETELLTAELQLRKELLEEAFAEKLITAEEREEMMAEMQKQYQEDITEHLKGQLEERGAAEEEAVKARKKGYQDMWNNFRTFSSNMQNQSKAMFALNKAAAIAEATVKGYQAVQAAWAWGNSVGGLPLGFAAAGIAAAASASNVAKIASVQYGGGGSVTPTSGGSVSSGSTVTGNNGQTTTDGVAGVPTSVNITLEGGSLYSDEQVRELIERINDNIGDNVGVNVA